MQPHILYVYAIGRAGHPMPATTVEVIDGTDVLRSIEAAGLTAFFTPVDAVEFSQPVIDARGRDLDWLGALGYRHQAVMTALMHGGTIIPLRAFTLFAGEESLRKHLEEERERFTKALDRLDGKQEWTLRIEFEPNVWSEALLRRVEPLRELSNQLDSAAPGKAFLLRKKIDEERKRASREAEQQVVAEVEDAIVKKLACEAVAESRQQRNGGFPQITVLINRDEDAVLQELREELRTRYGGDGVTVALTGPWPPYTFATVSDE